MSSHTLAYILLGAAWTAFAVLVAIVQARAQDDLEEPRASETAEPPGHLETTAA